MKDIIRKLNKKFVVIDPGISIQKAFELLADPDIDILIYISPDHTTFYYLTDLIINRKINDKKEISNEPVKSIANKSIVFNTEEYIKNKKDYVNNFKNILSRFGKPTPDRFLVMGRNKPLGLASDIVFGNIIDIKEPKFVSELEKFIESNHDPINQIEEFYEYLKTLGFDIKKDTKDHIQKLFEQKLQRLKEIELDQKLEPVLELEPELKQTMEVRSETKSEIETESKPEEVDTKVEPEIKRVKPDELNLVITYNPNHINHRPSVSSPEMPERLVHIMDLLKGREKVFSPKCRLISDYEPATEEDLLTCHTKRYVQFVMDYAAKGGGFLGDSTYITKYTHELALLAIGGAIRAAEEVLAGRASFGMGLIRPPGHHASKDKYGGYCIYNNAAILARYLQKKKGLEKILILDWDAHAANGTMDIFYDDPTVMLISLHQDPHNYYPKTGFISQLGKSAGLGYTINVEMPRGSGDEEYMTAFSNLVLPIYNKFQPEFIIGCNGFDSHHSDPYTDLFLTSKGYYNLAKIFRENMQDKMVILMEGGYNPYMGELTHTLINGLLGLPNPFEDNFQSLVQKVMSEEKIHVVLNEKIKELKYNLHRSHVI